MTLRKSDETLLHEANVGWMMRLIICAVCLAAALVLALEGRWSESGIFGVLGMVYVWVVWRQYVWRRKLGR